ncbi:patatin-like phospholipase family protein [Actinoallomurus spadix]|uniref:Patatin-like phospholipase family protein n=1 Tax=Actinoallomurus spadix TaxID=79912 RepID=A0ABN0VY37_9ACTN|nr:patatin-like phospholipase family protein [Actinoallomurus spadix]MCO5986008.1 patatin-like phospholipase family protein [Actinoallomurus spadix]
MTEAAQRTRQQEQREEQRERSQRGRREEPAEGTVGIVLAGAGARGAYEAGVMSILLPELDNRGYRPSVYVGTSAGAINAALFASLAHLDATEAAERALAMWRSVRRSMVFKPVLPSLPFAAMRYLLRLGNVPVPMTGGLLDTRPLGTALAGMLNWRDLHKNLRTGAVQAVAVAATASHTGRTQIFLESSNIRTPEPDLIRAIDYVDAHLTPEHVMASAAIPVLFPPVRIKTEETDGWYIDGGVRLNAPIEPALELGVERVVVIATDPGRRLKRPIRDHAGMPPTVQDTFAQLLNGALVDYMMEDLNTLRDINQLVRAGGTGVISRGSGRKYRVVDSLFAGPAPGDVDELGQLATTVLSTGMAGLRALQHPELRLLSTLIGPTMSRGELMSYLMFEQEFIDQAIELGRRDALRVLEPAKGKDGDIWSLCD